MAFPYQRTDSTTWTYGVGEGEHLEGQESECRPLISGRGPHNVLNSTEGTSTCKLIRDGTKVRGYPVRGSPLLVQARHFRGLTPVLTTSRQSSCPALRTPSAPGAEFARWGPGAGMIYYSSCVAPPFRSLPIVLLITFH